jgi:hypothetical protein
MFRGEPNAVSHGRAGSNEVVNHEHLLPWMYAALLQLEDVLARNSESAVDFFQTYRSVLSGG